MSGGLSERLAVQLELVLLPSAKLFAHEIVNASYLENMCLYLPGTSYGMDSKPPIYFRLPTKSFGLTITTTDGLQFNQRRTDLSTQYRTGCCSGRTYINSLMLTRSQSIQMCDCFIHSHRTQLITLLGSLQNCGLSAYLGRNCWQIS
jgi:hypothetical protein